MKYKDYYAILGLDKTADAAAIKASYRRLARKYHPDVSKDPDGEARFKEVAEAYHALKDPQKRAAYDELGRHPDGGEFRPSDDWRGHFSSRARAGGQAFDEADLAELFAGLTGGRRGSAGTPIGGRDLEADAEVSLEEAAAGTQLEIRLEFPDYDDQGRLRPTRRALQVRIPPGATAGQRLRLRGQGGHGVAGGPDGDLFLAIRLRPHALFRVSGRDLHFDLPLAPWEAALGATVNVKTLDGTVQLKVPPATPAGQSMRLAGRGIPGPNGTPGDLYAVVRITMPKVLSAAENDIYRSLAAASDFDPRPAFPKEAQHAG